MNPAGSENFAVKWDFLSAANGGKLCDAPSYRKLQIPSKYAKGTIVKRKSKWTEAGVQCFADERALIITARLKSPVALDRAQPLPRVQPLRSDSPRAGSTARQLFVMFG